jgi:hypothetical protein
VEESMVYAYVSGESEEQKGNVYFIRDGLGNIKIGIARDVGQRKKELQTANPNDLEVFYVMRVPDMWSARVIEMELHERFANRRKKGEWFEEAEIIDWLRVGKVTAGNYRFRNADW